MKKHLVPLLALSFIASCTETINTHGQVILPSRLAQIQPGTTTKDQVMQLLGSPSSTGTMNDNRWYYITSTVGTKAFNPHKLKDRRVIVMDFDPSSSIVTAMQEKTEEDGKTVDPDRKVTATNGQSMGILDQMLGNLGLGGPK